MRIAILGTRGIPNRYGGFEQFAEFAAPLLAERGHEVFVYNSSLHPYKGNIWKNVHRITRSDPENKWGTIGQFLYDLNCIRDARKRNFDIILQLGYTSSSIWSFLFPKDATIITNMDGFEWERKKYSRFVQWFLRHAEKWAVEHSHHLIADSTIMQSYITEKYNRAPGYISYGAIGFDQPDESALYKYQLEKYNYNLVIARLEPENNIEAIIEGHLDANKGASLFIVGSCENKYGRHLQKKFAGTGIRFYGPLFNLQELNQLRFYSHLYFHGHSVGGTNPSLLEAMASDALIVAHDNIFNKTILGDDALYFHSSSDIGNLLNQNICKENYEGMLKHNREKISADFSWDRVVDSLEDCFRMVGSSKLQESFSR